LGYRASSLLILPVDQVIRLLNLDVPAIPNVALDAVTSESISLHWQVPDKQSVSKHLIQLNGTIIGESDKKDTNVIVTGLTPDQLYCVRIIALNAQQLHSASEIIRVRTKPRTQDSIEDLHGISNTISC
jgi:Fibronectin type III domain